MRKQKCMHPFSGNFFQSVWIQLNVFPRLVHLLKLMFNVNNIHRNLELHSVQLLGFLLLFLFFGGFFGMK